MTRRRVVPLLAAVAAVVACTRGGAAHDRTASAQQPAVVQQAVDSLTGVVREVGADPATQLVLAPATGGRDLLLTGEPAAPLRSIAGAEVIVRGRAQPDAFAVAGFTVRAVNGQPVDDGIVTRAGQALELVMPSGARRSLPVALDGMVGRRVWISHPEPGRAPSYGLIQ